MEQTVNAQERINAYWNLRGATDDMQPRHGFDTDNERDAWLAALAELVPQRDRDVLDVGTGTGFLASLLAAQGRQVIGIDLSTGMLDVARANARASRPRPTADNGSAELRPDYDSNRVGGLQCRARAAPR